MKRTFIALDCHAESPLKKIVDEIKTSLKGGHIKWVDITHFHITLAFLGDTDNTSIDRVKEMIKGVAKGLAPFSINLKGTGVFKNIHDPQVIWVGIEKNEYLLLLYQAITDGLKFMDYKSSHHFSPHLTLGRIKYIKGTSSLKETLEEYGSYFFQESIIEEVIYYESILTPTGPIYKPLLRVPLS